MTKIEYAGLSDVGKVRNNNEDSILYSNNLLLVADGVGGEEGGEVASSLACKTIFEEFSDTMEKSGKPQIAIRYAVKKANESILIEASKKGYRMATTICVLYIHNNIAYYTHLGDSRIYLYRKKKMNRLTVDHKPAILKNAENGAPGISSSITNALGFSEKATFVLQKAYIRNGDILFSATDGLTNLLTDEEMKEVIFKSTSIKEVASRFIQEANNRGGADNITIGLIKIVKIKKKHLKHSFIIYPLITLALLAGGLPSIKDYLKQKIEKHNQQQEEERLQNEIKNFITGDWKKDWEQFNVNNILDFYSSGTKNRKRNMENESMWDKYRAREVAHIEIKDITLTKQESRVKASFVQNFRSDTFNETSLITLYLTKEDNLLKVFSDKEEFYKH